jgi:polyphosphate kinase
MLYLSSADWMGAQPGPRRVEVTFPILDPAVQAEVEALLERQWADNVKARVLDRDQTNLYRSGSSGKRLRGQLAQYQAVRKLALAQAGRSIRR